MAVRRRASARLRIGVADRVAFATTHAPGVKRGTTSGASGFFAPEDVELVEGDPGSVAASRSMSFLAGELYSRSNLFVGDVVPRLIFRA